MGRMVRDTTCDQKGVVTAGDESGPFCTVEYGIPQNFYNNQQKWKW